MILPRKSNMNYEKVSELVGYYMFIASSLTEEQERQLKEYWNKQGGYEVIEWWEFVMKNTKIELDIKED